jgi:hypothetical protein
LSISSRTQGRAIQLSQPILSLIPIINTSAVAHDDLCRMRKNQVVEPGCLGSFLERNVQSSTLTFKKVDDCRSFGFNDRSDIKYSAKALHWRKSSTIGGCASGVEAVAWACLRPRTLNLHWRKPMQTNTMAACGSIGVRPCRSIPKILRAPNGVLSHKLIVDHRSDQGTFGCRLERILCNPYL